MKTKLILAALTLSGIAAANPIETTTLTLTGVNGQSTDGDYVSPYTATLGTESLTVYCDDVIDQVSIGQSWEVNVYSGTSTSGSLYTSSEYPVLFWLAGQDTPANYVITQEAIWTETDPSYSGASPASDLLLGEAQVDSGSVNLADWDVITPVIPGGQEFLVDEVSSAPEPSTNLLIGIGLLFTGLLGVYKYKV